MNKKQWRIASVILLVLCVGVLALNTSLYPAAWLQWRLGSGDAPTASIQASPEEEPRVNPNAAWKVETLYRLSACDNRPGLKKIYVRVLDDKGEPLGGIKVRFAAEYGQGMAFDHDNVWGVTDQRGYLEWNHYGVPTRYILWMEDDEIPLVENLTTILPNEYCNPAPWPPQGWYGGWRPVNTSGIYSYRIVVVAKGAL